MLAVSDQVLAYVESGGEAEGPITISYIPLSSIVGLDLELNAKWISNRWFDVEEFQQQKVDLGEATIHLNYPAMTTIVLPLSTGDADDPIIQFLSSVRRHVGLV